MSDGFPHLRDGEVYATRTGLIYHPRRCMIVSDIWGTDRMRLFVIRETAVGDRQRCATCVTDE